MTSFQPGDVLFSTAGGVIFGLRKTLGVWAITYAVVDDDSSNPWPRAGTRIDATGRVLGVVFGNSTISATPSTLAIWSSAYDGDTGLPTPPVYRVGGEEAESLVILPGGDILVGCAGLPADAGASHASNQMYRYTSGGVLVTTYAAAPDVRGTDWIDLGIDGDTVYYTSEGRKIKRWSLSTGQLSDLVSLPVVAGTRLFALRCLPDGTFLVADKADCKHISALGAVLRTYLSGDPNVDGDWFALTLDPDGVSFWAASASLGIAYRFNIATGTVIDHIGFDDGEGGEIGIAPTFGLSVYPSLASDPPIIDAGSDHEVAYPATAILTDDSAAPGGCPSGLFTLLWTKVSGPGTVTFSDPTALHPTVYFSEGGTYVLRLTGTCTSGGATASDTTQVLVDGPTFSFTPVTGPAMERYFAFSRLNDQATPAPYATVHVYNVGTPILANIYQSNDLGDPMANPFTTGADGLAAFYAENGRYDIRYSGGGILVPWAEGDHLLDDPADSNVGPQGPPGDPGPAGQTGPTGPAGADGGVGYGARIYRSTDFLLDEVTPTAVQFDTTVFDDASFFTLAQPTRLTVPAGKGGLYVISGAGTWDVLAILSRTVFLAVNGVPVAAMVDSFASSSVLAVQYGGPCSTVVRLVPGDYVELVLYWDYNPGLPPFTIKGGASRTWLSIARVGS